MVGLMGAGCAALKETQKHDNAVLLPAGLLGLDSVRLIGGNSTQGRVEVLRAGSWQPVSMTQHTGLAVAVICRQLGFAGGVAADPPVETGVSVGVPSLHLTVCTGSEPTWEECGCRWPGVTNTYRCGNFDTPRVNDVGQAPLYVTCAPGEGARHEAVGGSVRGQREAGAAASTRELLAPPPVQ